MCSNIFENLFFQKLFLSESKLERVYMKQNWDEMIIGVGVRLTENCFLFLFLIRIRLYFFFRNSFPYMDPSNLRE